MFWLALCRAEEERLPPAERDGGRAEVGSEGSHVGCCGAPSLTSLARMSEQGSLQRAEPQGWVRTGAPKGRAAAVSNRFALISHFTTTNITPGSYWKSCIPVRARILVRDLHRKGSWLHWFAKVVNSLDESVQTPTISQAIALVHWPERKYLASCSEPVDFKKSWIVLFLQSKYRAISRGQLPSPLFWNVVSDKGLQMPPFCTFVGLSPLPLPCYVGLLDSAGFLRSFFSSVILQHRVNNLKYFFKKVAGGF